MKKILITGKGSYIGTSFEKWLSVWPEKYQVESIDMKSEKWREAKFTEYDVILHVAGIAHVSTNSKMESLYYSVNRDLAIETAKKAKAENVKQFIFMSSIIIYGDDARIGETKIITKDTIPNPSNFYGRSKLEADECIQGMADHKFKAVIIRTPMVYGPGCKGNFPKLQKLAEYFCVFPNIENQRSMIYIDNLCTLFQNIIDTEATGVFFPQNEDYVATKDIIKEFRLLDGKRTCFIKVFNPLFELFSRRFSFINKVFGNKVYDNLLSASSCGNKYNQVGFSESIKRCRLG